MNYIEFSYRHAKAIINNDEELKKKYTQFTQALESITDEDLINDFKQRKENHIKKNTSFKSLTPSINHLLKERIKSISGWKYEVDIFNDTSNKINNTEWRLDFACENAFAVEVAFNHGEAICWNLLKPVLASELNHVTKSIQTKIGIYVCATNKLKLFGNIDSASGSYEKVLRYLNPLSNQLTIPIMIIGLEQPDSFFISNETSDVKPKSEYRVSYKQILKLVKDFMTENSIEFKASNKITKNKKPQKFKIYSKQSKFAIYETIGNQEIIDTLESDNYLLLDIKKILSDDDLDELLRNLGTL